MPKFRPRDPAEYRWLGRALDDRRIPVAGRTRRRIGVLAQLIGLSPSAPVGLVASELMTFEVGKRG